MTNPSLENSTTVRSWRDRAFEPLPGSVQVWVTDKERRFEQGNHLLGRLEHRDHLESVVLDPNNPYQEILGFGCALTDAACLLLSKMPAAKRRDFLEEIFDRKGIGLSVCRICIGASDYASSAYSYDDGGPDPEMLRFSIDHDRAYILPILAEVLEFCPDLFVVASPWSPPGWMKVGNSMFGGSMQRKHFAAYARYFKKFIEAYGRAGVPVHAITIQNEVDTDQEGLMPACLWSQGSEMRFVAEHLGPCLAEEKTGTKIWILDHNYDLWGRAISELADPRVSQFVDGVAWHGYAGEPSRMASVQKLYASKHMYWTEGGPEDLDDPQLQTNWGHWGVKFSEIVNHWARCIITWNLALDEDGKPNIGPFSCAGLVTIESDTQKIIPSGQYWALTHFSRSVRRGAHRIQSGASLSNVSHSAFVNPDGSYVVILTNPGAGKSISVAMPDWEAQVNLPADSLTTISVGTLGR